MGLGASGLLIAWAKGHVGCGDEPCRCAEKKATRLAWEQVIRGKRERPANVGPDATGGPPVDAGLEVVQLELACCWARFGLMLGRRAPLGLLRWACPAC